MNIDRILEYLKQAGLEIKNKADIIIDCVKHGEENVKPIKVNEATTENVGSLSENSNVLLDAVSYVKELLLSKFSGNGFFVFDLYNEYIKFLDSLTLLQESAFLHILMFIYIICSLFTFVGVFFGNELIKYFDLENKNSYLAIFLKARAKFQRYYLIWTIFMLFIVCLVGLFLNFLAFTVKIV